MESAPRLQTGWQNLQASSWDAETTQCGEDGSQEPIPKMLSSTFPRRLPSLLATGRRLFMIMTSCGSATGSTSSATSANTFGPQTFPTSDKRETNKSSSLPKNSPDHYPMSAGTSTQDSHRMIYESGNLQQSVTS